MVPSGFPIDSYRPFESSEEYIVGVVGHNIGIL